MIVFLCLLVGIAYSYEVAVWYKDTDCSDEMETMATEAGDKPNYADGEVESDECYLRPGNFKIIKEVGDVRSQMWKCEGGSTYIIEDTTSEDCNGDWEEWTETTCDGYCQTHGSYSMRCYCAAYQATSALWLTVIFMGCIPCCCFGCWCIIVFVACIWCCCCGTGGCFSNL